MVVEKINNLGNNTKAVVLTLQCSLRLIGKVNSQDLFFKELSRITKKGGIIVVREHDVNDEILESMLRSLHFMHDVSNKVTGKDSKTYIESYYSMNQLIKLFEKYDFKLLANLDFRTKTGAYFIAFQKN